MSEMIDFEKEAEKISAQARAASKATIDPGVQNPDEVKPVAEKTDYTKLVDENGHVTDLPTDPNVAQTQPEQPQSDQPQPEQPQPGQPQPEQPQPGQPQPGQPQPGQPQPGQPQPEQPQPEQPQQDAPMRPGIHIKEPTKTKSEGYLDKAAEVLKSKLEQATQGSNADEIAQNATVAMLTFFFDLIGEWADHHRKEAKRIKDKDKEKNDAYIEKRLTQEHNAGVRPLDKDLSAWLLLVDHPEMQKYQGKKPVPKEAKKAALKIYDKDKKLQGSFQAFLETMSDMTYSPAQAREVFAAGVMKANTNDASLGSIREQLKGEALNGSAIGRALEQVGSYIPAMKGLHADVQGIKAQQAANSEQRQMLNMMRQMSAGMQQMAQGLGNANANANAGNPGGGNHNPLPLPQNGGNSGP